MFSETVLNSFFCIHPNYRLALQAFMDAFQGCFKETPYDCWHLAALRLTMRFIYPLLYMILELGVYLPAASLLILLMALIIKFQPFKYKQSNF